MGCCKSKETEPYLKDIPNYTLKWKSYTWLENNYGLFDEDVQNHPEYIPSTCKISSDWFLINAEGNIVTTHPLELPEDERESALAWVVFK